MEIETSFSTIMGIVMMVAVVIAVVALMTGLSKIYIEECTPIEYEAKSTYAGTICGTDGTNQLKCKSYRNPSTGQFFSDECMDDTIKACCPIINNHIASDKQIIIKEGRCCQIANLTYK